ncbi:MAG: hypothetical protein U5K56_21600 [Halioglobus sp.]|nr:hypothetical protein [Halioglobus sp.]
MHGAYALEDIDDDLDSGDDSDIWELDATWYPCRNLSLGTGYTYTDLDDVEQEDFRVFGEYFITDDVAVGLAYTESEIDDIDFERETYAFSARFRF